MPAFDQRGDVRQPRVFGLDLVPARQVVAERTQLLHRHAQAFAFDLPGLAVGFGVPAPLARSLPGMPGCAHGGGQRLRAGIGIEHLALGLRTQQRVMRLLAVDVEQEVGRVLQLRQRRRAAVDEGARAAAGVDHATQDQRAVVGGEAGFIEPGRQCWQAVDGEFNRDFRTGGAAAYHAAFGAVTQRQRQRIDQDGFAGAGLAGEDGQPRREIKLDRFDQQVVADG